MIQFLKRLVGAVPPPDAGTVRLFADETGAFQVMDEAGDVTPLGSGGGGGGDTFTVDGGDASTVFSGGSLMIDFGGAS